MGKQFRGIRPEDMTKLQNIIEMVERGSSSYAAKIADSINEPVARGVADILLNRAKNPPGDYRAFATELTNETNALVKKLAIA